MRSQAILTALISGLLIANGCGGPSVAIVEGEITFEGRPVSRGMITLEPADGIGPSSGGNVEGGKYRVERVVPGPKIVKLSAAKVVGTVKEYEDDPNSPVREITEELLPKRFNESTELKLDVKAPKTTEHFRLITKDGA